MEDDKLVSIFLSRAWNFKVPEDKESYNKFVSGLRAIYGRAQWDAAHQIVNRKISKDKENNRKDYTPYNFYQIIFYYIRRFFKKTNKYFLTYRR